MMKNEASPLLGIMASRIKNFRQINHLTQAELADRAGVSLNYLGKLEIAARTPSLEALEGIAGALGVGVADLLSPDDDRMHCAEFSAITSGLTKHEIEFLIKGLADWADYLKKHRSLAD